MKLAIPKLALCIGLCFVFAFAGSYFTPLPGSEWYYSVLHKPSWNPPDWLFPPAWSLLFLLMGIALYLVVQQKSEQTKGSSRNLMEKKFHFTAPLDCHVQLATVKEYPCSIAFEASKPSGSRL